jgi:hypothetical protein
MSDLKAGTKAGIFSAKRSYVYVDVPEWGGVFCVQSMTGDERDEFEQGLSDRKGRTTLKSFRAKLVAASLVESEENPVLLITNGYETTELGKGPVAPLQKIYNVATALNGMSDEDVASLTVDFKRDGASAGSSTSV